MRGHTKPIRALYENLYAQFVPESQRRALAKMSAMVEARTSKPIAPASTSGVATPQQSRMVN